MRLSLFIMFLFMFSFHSIAQERLLCRKAAKSGEMICDTAPPGSFEDEGIIDLNSRNLVVLRGPITTNSASLFVKRIQGLYYTKGDDRIFVWIRSPGGSIFAGDSITNAIRSSPKEVITIIDFAASMAFHVASVSDKRIIMPTGTMMQHHASGGVGFKEFPNVDTQWRWLKRKVAIMERIDAEACKIKLSKFRKLRDRDLWLNGEEAVKMGCAHQQASQVICSKELLESTVKEEIDAVFFTIEVEWAACPLEQAPRNWSVHNKMGAWNEQTPSKEEQRYIHDLLILIKDPMSYFSANSGFWLDPISGMPKRPEFRDK